VLAERGERARVPGQDGVADGGAARIPGRMVLPTAVQPGFRAKRKVTVER